MSQVFILVFERDGKIDHETGWNGPWPPPSAFAVATGAKSGQRAHIDLDEPDCMDKVATARAMSTVEVIFYTRQHYSELPPIQGILRGALYKED